MSVLLAPDEVGMHPSFSNRPPPFTVIRWIAGSGEAGSVNVEGNFRKPNATGSVTFDIFVDGTLLINQTFNCCSIGSVAFNETVTVGAGSTIDFVVGSIFDDTSDLAALSVTVSTVPIPAAVWLFGSALCLLGWVRRKTA